MKGLNIKRALAYYLDFYLSSFIIVFPGKLIAPFIYQLPPIVGVIASIVLYIIFYILFSKRDYFTKGRSIGKKIFGLVVCNELDGELPDNKTLVKRGNIEFLTFAIDFPLILFAGKGVSDYICKTEVRGIKA